MRPIKPMPAVPGTTTNLDLIDKINEIIDRVNYIVRRELHTHEGIEPYSSFIKRAEE